jgi:hypothetical protein
LSGRAAALIEATLATEFQAEVLIADPHRATVLAGHVVALIEVETPATIVAN